MAAIILWILLVPLVACLPSPMSQSDPRIINGTLAEMENTRHQVSIRSKTNEVIFGTGHICGGSLISAKIVLSAAHCFYDDEEQKFISADKYFVVLGTLNRFEKNENTISYDLSRIVYADFNRTTFTNDVAILFLDGTVPATNPAVRVIKMNKDVLPIGTVCQVTGWGIMESGISAMDLMTVDVPIIDRETCSSNYGNGSIVDGMICAGYMEGEKDACQGDSGGPLVYNGTLVGIVSFGDGCASPGFPGVYADVRHYVDWIEEIMKSGASSRSFSTIFTLLGLIFICCHKY